MPTQRRPSENTSRLCACAGSRTSLRRACRVLRRVISYIITCLFTATHRQCVWPEVGVGLIVPVANTIQPLVSATLIHSVSVWSRAGSGPHCPGGKYDTALGIRNLDPFCVCLVEGPDWDQSHLSLSAGQHDYQLFFQQVFHLVNLFPFPNSANLITLEIDTEEPILRPNCQSISVDGGGREGVLDDCHCVVHHLLAPIYGPVRQFVLF